MNVISKYNDIPTFVWTVYGLNVSFIQLIALTPTFHAATLCPWCTGPLMGSPLRSAHPTQTSHLSHLQWAMWPSMAVLAMPCTSLKVGGYVGCRRPIKGLYVAGRPIQGLHAWLWLHCQMGWTWSIKQVIKTLIQVQASTTTPSEFKPPLPPPPPQSVFKPPLPPLSYLGHLSHSMVEYLLIVPKTLAYMLRVF